MYRCFNFAFTLRRAALGLGVVSAAQLFNLAAGGILDDLRAFDDVRVA